MMYLSNFSQIPSAFVLFFLLYVSLMRVSLFAYSRIDFGMKTSELMLSDVVQIQLKTSLYSHYTSLQRADVNFADFRPKLTGVF